MSKQKQTSKFSVIWKETYRRNLRSGSFIFMAILPILIIGIFNVVSHFMSQQQEESKLETIGIVSVDSNLTASLQSMSVQPSVIHLTEEQAIEKLANDEIPGYLVLTRNENQEILATYNKKATSKDVNLTDVKQALSTIRVQEMAANSGVSNEVVMELLTAQVSIQENKLNEESLKQGKVSYDNEQGIKDMIRQQIAYGSVMLLYMFFITYGSLVGQEIASEKGTRMMEVILSSTDAATHFWGKIVGVSLIILTQLGLYALIGIGYLLTIGKGMLAFLEELDVFNLASNMIFYTVLFIILGCAMYIIISALLGSIATKIEDVQKVLMPIIMFDVIGLYIGIFALTMPNALLVKIASWFPLLTPLVMPFRVATDTVSSIELWGAIGLTIVFTIVVAYVSVYIYRSNVLIYSDKGPLQVMKQSFELLKSQKRGQKK